MSNAVTADLPRTLAEFAAAPAELLAFLKESGKGRRLHIEGGRTVVVVDEEVFKKLRREEERAALLESLMDADAGRVVPALEALDALAAQHGLKPVGG